MKNSKELREITEMKTELSSADLPKQIDSIVQISVPGAQNNSENYIHRVKAKKAKGHSSSPKSYFFSEDSRGISPGNLRLHDLIEVEIVF